MGEHSGAWVMGGGTQRYGVPLQVGRSRIRAGIGDGSRGRGQLPGEKWDVWWRVGRRETGTARRHAVRMPVPVSMTVPVPIPAPK